MKTFTIVNVRSVLTAANQWNPKWSQMNAGDDRVQKMLTHARNLSAREGHGAMLEESDCALLLSPLCACCVGGGHEMLLTSKLLREQGFNGRIIAVPAECSGTISDFDDGAFPGKHREERVEASKAHFEMVDMRKSTDRRPDAYATAVYELINRD